jgi:hypothetical protein
LGLKRVDCSEIGDDPASRPRRPQGNDVVAQGDTSRGGFGFGGLVAQFATKARNQIALLIEKNVQQCTRGVETCTALPKAILVRYSDPCQPSTIVGMNHHELAWQKCPQGTACLSCRWFAGIWPRKRHHDRELFGTGRRWSFHDGRQ